MSVIKNPSPIPLLFVTMKGIQLLNQIYIYIERERERESKLNGEKDCKHVFFPSVNSAGAKEINVPEGKIKHAVWTV